MSRERVAPTFGNEIYGVGKNCLTKSQAKKLAKRQARNTGLNIQAYACRTCRRWHVGTLRRGLA
jgi:hypothetical protein